MEGLKVHILKGICFIHFTAVDAISSRGTERRDHQFGRVRYFPICHCTGCKDARATLKKNQLCKRKNGCNFAKFRFKKENS